MTRLFAFSLVALAFAFGACQRHPLPGQEPVTHTHGSGGTEAEGHGEKGDVKPDAAKEEKKGH